MLSNKPYLLRAFYEWIVDSSCTPFLVVDATAPRCNVPQEFIEDGEIILNIAPEAIRDLKIGRDLVEFKASFTGIVHLISAPVQSVLAIYAEENGQGMFFDYDEETDFEGNSENELDNVNPEKTITKAAKVKKRHLQLVE